jgi:hypothetical protein
MLQRLPHYKGFCLPQTGKIFLFANPPFLGQRSGLHQSHYFINYDQILLSIFVHVI